MKGFVAALVAAAVLLAGCGVVGNVQQLKAETGLVPRTSEVGGIKIFGLSILEGYNSCAGDCPARSVIVAPPYYGGAPYYGGTACPWGNCYGTPYFPPGPPVRSWRDFAPHY